MNKIFITILSVLGSLIVILVFGIVPLLQGISKDTRKLQTQKQELEIFKKETQEIENFQAFSQEKRQDLEGLELLFVSPETPIPFIEFLEQYAAPLGVELTIVPGEPKQVKGDAWPSLEFRISSIAPYPAAFALLKAIENSPFALEIKNVAMDALRENRNVAFSFIVKAYTK